MNLTPKLSPKSLNEWTLEQNLVREIANMFDTPFGMFYPIRLRNIFDIRAIEISRFTRRKTKSYKLTPREEGTGGGWDTKFVIPQSLGHDSRVVYLQFKCGVHSNGNNITGSIFNIQLRDPNQHIEFSFNDNGNPAKGKLATQHNHLKELNDYLISKGFSNKSVLYAFPRIKDLETFDALQEPVIFYTTFLSHNQMDIEAKSNQINLYDGNVHYFRTCYVDEVRREISSTPFQLSGEDESVGLLEEIMMVKLARIWNYHRESINNQRLKDYLNLALCQELSLNPYQFMEEPFKIYLTDDGYDFSEYLQELQSRREANERQVFEIDLSTLSSTRKILFNSVYNFINNLSTEVNINTQIPQNFSTALTVDRIRRRDASTAGDYNLGDVSVTSIVF